MIRVSIEIDKDGQYWLHNEDGGKSVSIGIGSSIEEAKEDFFNTCNELKAVYEENGEEIPEELIGPYEFIPDMESFAEYFSRLAAKPIKTTRQRTNFQKQLNKFGQSIANFAF